MECKCEKIEAVSEFAEIEGVKLPIYICPECKRYWTYKSILRKNGECMWKEIRFNYNTQQWEFVNATEIDANISEIKENNTKYPEYIMTKIEIIVERTQRVSMKFEATEEQIEQLRLGDNPFYDELIPFLDKEDPEYDYEAYDLDNDKLIIGWG